MQLPLLGPNFWALQLLVNTLDSIPDKPGKWCIVTWDFWSSKTLCLERTLMEEVLIWTHILELAAFHPVSIGCKTKWFVSKVCTLHTRVPTELDLKFSVYPTAYCYIKKNTFPFTNYFCQKWYARIINVEAFFSRTIMGVNKCNFKINSVHVQTWIALLGVINILLVPLLIRAGTNFDWRMSSIEKAM